MCGTAWAAPNTTSVKDQLKAELGGAKSSTGATQGPKKTYAQAVATGGTAPCKTVLGKPSTSSVEVPAVKEDGAFDMGTDSEEVSHTTSLALPEEYDAVAARLSHPPPLTNEDWSATAELDKVLPKKGGADVVRLEEEAEGLKALHGLQLKKIAVGDPSATSKKLEALEKRLEKLANSATAAPLARCELEVVAKQLARTEEERAARTAAGAVNSEENGDRLEEICREQMEGWQQLLVTVQAERSTRTAAWLAREMLLEGRALELKELAEEKIAAANGRSGSGSGESSSNDNTEVKSQLDQALAELTRQKEEAAAERKGLLDRLAALEQAAGVKPSAEDPNEPVRLQAKIYTQCSLAVVYTEDELPSVKAAPDKTERFHLALIQQNLAHWAQAGMIPATFAHLLQGAKGQEEGALAMMKSLVGEQIWERFFQGVEVVTAQYVPFQLASILNTALSKAEALLKKCNKEWDLASLAKAHFSSLLDQDAEAKRARTGRYAARPGPY